MSVEKLRTWLNIPDGPWPPTHYTLIGLKNGEGTPEAIEGRILERLELLRRYQLPYPDEATEGMNLLAKALDCLTNPDARRTYDQKLGLITKAKPDPEPEPADDLIQTLFNVPVLPATEESILPERIALPDVEDDLELDDLEYDVMPESEILVEVIVEDPSSTRSTPPPLPEAILLPDTKAPVPPPLPPPARPRQVEVTPKKRVKRPTSAARKIYTDLARIRKVLRVWERARPFLSDLDRTISRRTDSVALLGWLAEVRPLLPTVDDLIGGPRQPGSIIAVVARQRLVIDMFRTLLPSQREALAKDYRAAHFRLAEEYDALRTRVRRRTEKDWVRAIWNPLLKHLGHYPEWFLLFLSILIVGVAALRSL